MKSGVVVLVVVVLAVLVVVGYGAGRAGAVPAERERRATAAQSFTLRTGIVEGRMAFVGEGGALDGAVNPTLVIDAGAVAHVTVQNGDGMAHDFAVPALGVKSALVNARGASTAVVIATTADQIGTYDYYCTVAGHRQAGMAGQIIIR